MRWVGPPPKPRRRPTAAPARRRLPVAASPLDLALLAAATPCSPTLLPPLPSAPAQGGEDPLSLPPHGTEVFVGGLPKTVGEQQLRDFASEAGDVHSAKLIRDPNNPSQNRGYGFVK